MTDKAPFAGQLNITVTLQYVQGVQNSIGEPVKTVNQLFTARAMAEPTRGTEEIDGKVREITQGVYVIRKRAGLREYPNLQLVDDGQVFHVYHIEKIGRTHLRLHCRDNDE